MYAKITLLLIVAATAAACAQNDQLACREVQSPYGVKGPGCALDVAESDGANRYDPPTREIPQDRPSVSVAK